MTEREDGSDVGQIEVPNSLFYAASIGQHLQDQEKSASLRPYQKGVLGDVQRFFERDLRRGFIELPTGTGKTVLFVVLAKALLAQQNPDRRPPRILVVVPTKDLVHQALGKNKERGFGRFAPEIDVASFFSDTPLDQRSAYRHSQVVITTYRSFNILSQQGGISRRVRQAMGVDRKISPILDSFDAFFLDEAHHARGGISADLVNSLPEDKVVIGFTATPEADETRKLSDVLPHLIHRLELNEAIGLGLISPVVPLGLKSEVNLRSTDIFNDHGEYLDERIVRLAEDKGRNRLIIDAASAAAKAKLGVVISCIAGDTAWHARHLADELKLQGIRAEAIYDRVPAVQRAAIYRQFEAGEVDALTYVGVLGEGWDSQQAKVLINSRPTRSMIVAKQRFGRITRLPNVAFSIDICDGDDGKNPAITAADFLNEGSIMAGRVLGEVVDVDFVGRFVAELRQRLPVMPILEPRYLTSLETLESLDPIFNGQMTSVGRRDPDFAIPSRIYPTYSRVTDEMIEKMSQLSGLPVDSKVGRQGQIARKAYNISQVSRLLEALPNIKLGEYYLDNKQAKWITSLGLVTLFSNRYPGLDQRRVEEVLEGISLNLEWRPARHNIAPQGSVYRHFHVLKIYKADPRTVDLVNQALKAHL